MLFVEHYAREACWRNYSYIDEMKADALMQLCKCNEKGGNDHRPTIRKFDVEYAACKAALVGTPALLPNAFAWTIRERVRPSQTNPFERVQLIGEHPADWSIRRYRCRPQPKPSRMPVKLPQASPR